MDQGRNVVPLGSDASSRYLPWIFALMVYLAALGIAVMFVLHDGAGRWGRGETGALTVQVLPVEDEAEEPRLARALQVLNDTPGIIEATALDVAENMALLEPWLGTGDLVRDMPLPRLIDVTADPDVLLDLDMLATRLRAVVPGITVEDPKRWLSDLGRVGRSLEALAGAIVFFIGLAAVATVVFTTRMGLSVHHEIIGLLHQIGAEDAYVARLFQRQALRVGLKGGVPGAMLAAGTLVGLGETFRQIENFALPRAEMSIWAWVAIGAVPLLLTGIAVLTAWLTAIRVLRRMP